MFGSKKRKAEEALILNSAERVFRIEGVMYPNWRAGEMRLAVLNGRMLKGDVQIGDKVIACDDAYEIVNVKSGVDPVTGVQEGVYAGLVVAYQPISYYKLPFKKGAVKIQVATLGKSSALQSQVERVKEKKDTHPIRCARCKKEIAPEEATWIGSHRFCQNCAKAPDASKTVPQSDWQAVREDRYAPDRTMVSAPVGGDREALLAKERAIQVLREGIIQELTKNKGRTYQLASLLWAEAARCFPCGGSWQWDGAWFQLDLTTRKLYADVSTYPNSIGACREDRYPLSSAEFHRIANEFDFAPELKAMESDADWEALFDDRLAAVASDVTTAEKEQQGGASVRNA